MLLGALALAGCSSNEIIEAIPTSSTLYEDKQALVAETVKLNRQDQTLVKGQPLTKYQVEGVVVYCSDMLSGDFSLYRCFGFEGNNLVSGLNPQTQELEPLGQKIAIRFVEK